MFVATASLFGLDFPSVKISLYIQLHNTKLSFLCKQNFLYTSKDDNSTLKAIDFGLSDFVKPGLSFSLKNCQSQFRIRF